MGVDISTILQKTEKNLEYFSGFIVGIDACNALYQFLASIRQPDGTPLKDTQNRITSHISGIFYRTANLLDYGIKPVYIFDGESHKLKHATIQQRHEIRERAKIEWEEALLIGDLETAKTKAMQSSTLTKDMVMEIKELLQHLGIPYVDAVSEGEAQASFMNSNGTINAVASQDFDSLLFGAKTLIRNLTITGRRKLPRKNVYVDVKPEIIYLDTVLNNLQITRDQLVDIGLLVGTDFNLGIKGIGAKKAYQLIKQYGCLENLPSNLNVNIENYQKIREIFLNPKVTENYNISFNTVNYEKAKEFLCEIHDFSEYRVDKTLKKYKYQKEIQKSIEDW